MNTILIKPRKHIYLYFFSFLKKNSLIEMRYDRIKKCCVRSVIECGYMLYTFWPAIPRTLVSLEKVEQLLPFNKERTTFV